MNKVVLVTGASSGIGAAIAEKFAHKSANVVLVGRNEHKLHKVQGKCEKHAQTSLVIRADVSKDSDVKKIIDTTVKKYGKLDVLVNNAGILGANSIFDKDFMREFDKVMATNLRAAVYLAHEAAPHLVKTKGNIVNISSIAGLMTFNKMVAAYGAAKAGLNHFTKYVAFELAAKGVRVNNVNPGPLQTELFDSKLNEGELKALWQNVVKDSPMHTMPTAMDIADLVLFLSSDEAKCITGTDNVIDCGTVLKGSTSFDD